MAAPLSQALLVHGGVSRKQHIWHKRPIDSSHSEVVQIGSMRFRDPKSSYAIGLWPIRIAIPVVVFAGLVSAVGAGGLIWLGLGRPQLVR
jgi:hypothetical protein